MFRNYLQRAEIAISAEEFESVVESHLDRLALACDGSLSLTDDELLRYKVPELTPDGACSIFEDLAEEPYDLTRVVGELTPEIRTLLVKLHQVVNYVVSQSDVEWFGIYRGFAVDNEDPVLAKLAYFGVPSRAEFPLTEDFMSRSNNVNVAFTGKARVINDIQQYVLDGGEYYTCDPKVESEVCLPIFDYQGNSIGIIDAEAFSKDFFNGNEQALMVAVCMYLSDLFMAEL